MSVFLVVFFFFSSRRRHTRLVSDWSSDVCSSDLVVGLDLGCVVDGFYGDAARTVGVGRVSDAARRLMKVTEDSLRAGIDRCRPGNRVGDIGHAVQAVAEAGGFSVVRDRKSTRLNS